MPRKESRTKTAIWLDEQFTGLTVYQQRLYWLLYSQPNISLCGVVPYTPGRWARLASDDTVDALEAALHDLERSEHIVVDWETEEVFVRSFMRNDGVWKSPKTRGVAVESVAHVMSTRIRVAVEKEIERLEADPLQNPR